MPPHRQIFFNGEMLKDTSSLDDLEDPPLGDLFRGEPVDPFPHELNAAVGDFTVFVIEQAGNSLEGSALPRAVRAQKGNNPVLRNFNRNPLEDKDDLVVPDLNVVDLQDIILGHNPSPFSSDVAEQRM